MAELRRLAQSHTDSAIAALVEVLSNKKTPAAARVSAATALLDRGYGKPVSLNALTDSEGKDARDELSPFESLRLRLFLMTTTLRELGFESVAQQINESGVPLELLRKVKHEE